MAEQKKTPSQPDTTRERPRPGQAQPTPGQAQPTDPPTVKSPLGKGQGKEPQPGQESPRHQADVGKQPKGGPPPSGEGVFKVGEEVRFLPMNTPVRIEAVKPDNVFGCITLDGKHAFDAQGSELGRPQPRARRSRDPGNQPPEGAPGVRDQAPDGRPLNEEGREETLAPTMTRAPLPGETADPRFAAGGAPVESPRATSTGHLPDDPSHREDVKEAVPHPEALARHEQQEADFKRMEAEKKAAEEGKGGEEGKAGTGTPALAGGRPVSGPTGGPANPGTAGDSGPGKAGRPGKRG